MGIVTQGEYNSLTQAQSVSGKFAKLQIDKYSNLLVAEAAGQLVKGGATSIITTCTLANTNYELENSVPAGTRYLSVYGSASFIIAMGEATSNTVGMQFGATTRVLIPIKNTGEGGADYKVNVQSPSAGATVRVTYLSS